MKPHVYIETLGCSKNQVDTEIMLSSLVRASYQWTADPAQAEVILVNTCGFLQSAVEESIDRILSLAQYKQQGNCKALVAVGCMIQRYGKDLLQEIPELDGILGSSDYTAILGLVTRILGHQERVALVEERPGYEASNLNAERLRVGPGHQAYLKISEGCSNKCSFCNIPKLRGPMRAKPQEMILAEAGLLLSQGVKELTLLAQDTSAYQSTQGGLLELCQALLRAQGGDYWLRILYAYPNNFPLGLFPLMNQDPRLLPYADLPLQHIDDGILKSMRREVTEAEIRPLLEAGAKAGITLRTSLIVGFPGEGEREFRRLLRLVEEGWFHHVGVFCFSDEDNIQAHKFARKVPVELAEERRNALMEAQQAVSLQKNQTLLGRTLRVLVEGVSQETELLLQARAAHQAPEVDGVTLINEGSAPAGSFALAEVVEAHPYDLVARILEE